MQNQMAIQELGFAELEEVAGGGEEWSTSLTVSTALLGGALVVSSPLLAGAFAAGSILASGAAIYYALDE